MELKQPQEGYIYIRRKDKGSISLIPKESFDAKRHELVDYKNPYPAKESKEDLEKKELEEKLKAEKAALEAKAASLESKRAELAEMSLFKLKQLPEFEAHKNSNFKNKEELIEALLGLVSKTE